MRNQSAPNSAASPAPHLPLALGAGIKICTSVTCGTGLMVNVNSFSYFWAVLKSPKNVHPLFFFFFIKPLQLRNIENEIKSLRYGLILATSPTLKATYLLSNTIN